MDQAEILVPGLLVAVAALSAIARVINVPYPILLVIGGLGLGFVPGVPDVKLDPDLVLVLILPPLLYSAAFFSSLRDLRADLRPISTLAIGLVLATTVSVAVVAHALVDGLPWAAAFALGAIVSPTDPLAATAIARRLGAPRRFVNIIEGESLINDGTALVAYKVAVAAVVGGSFSLLEASADFVLGAAGGIAIGLAVGWVVAKIRRRLDDPPVEITISLFTAYAAYLPAQELGLSGVLASVTVGIFLGWRAPELTTPTTRMQSYAVWEVLVFLLNASLFVLVGLQVQSVLDGISEFSPSTLIGYAAAICAVVVATRLVWLELITHLIRLLYSRAPHRIRRGTWRLRLVNSWAGMRGSVSLAAALALPTVTDAGTPFPQRDLLIFLTYAVILFTLVVQGLSLPLLIRALGVEDDGAEEREEIAARRSAARAAIARVDALEVEEWTRADTVERMRGLYGYRLRRFDARVGEVEDDGYEQRSVAYQRMVHEVIGAQREELVRMRNAGEISDEVRRRIERELDLEESRLEV
jgi:CPA1 family monovalent cation:H+ antiporter